MKRKVTERKLYVLEPCRSVSRSQVPGCQRSDPHPPGRPRRCSQGRVDAIGLARPTVWDKLQASGWVTEPAGGQVAGVDAGVLFARSARPGRGARCRACFLGRGVHGALQRVPSTAQAVHAVPRTMRMSPMLKTLARGRPEGMAKMSPRKASRG